MFSASNPAERGTKDGIQLHPLNTDDLCEIHSRCVGCGTSHNKPRQLMKITFRPSEYGSKAITLCTDCLGNLRWVIKPKAAMRHRATDGGCGCRSMMMTSGRWACAGIHSHTWLLSQ